jgi:hypothetical protein
MYFCSFKSFTCSTVRLKLSSVSESVSESVFFYSDSDPAKIFRFFRIRIRNNGVIRTLFSSGTLFCKKGVHYKLFFMQTCQTLFAILKIPGPLVPVFAVKNGGSPKATPGFATLLTKRNFDLKSSKFPIFNNPGFSYCGYS